MSVVLQRLCVCNCICGMTMYLYLFVFLMIRRPPRSTLDRSSAASDVYKRQPQVYGRDFVDDEKAQPEDENADERVEDGAEKGCWPKPFDSEHGGSPVSYTHLRAHETVLDLVCRLLLENKPDNTLAHENILSQQDLIT